MQSIGNLRTGTADSTRMRPLPESADRSGAAVGIEASAARAEDPDLGQIFINILMVYYLLFITRIIII